MANPTVSGDRLVVGAARGSASPTVPFGAGLIAEMAYRSRARKSGGKTGRGTCPSVPGFQGQRIRSPVRANAYDWIVGWYPARHSRVGGDPGVAAFANGPWIPACPGMVSANWPCVSRCDHPMGLALSPDQRRLYTSTVQTRRILVLVSVLGASATLIAVVEGAWLYALVLYGVSVVGLGVLLGRAVRKHRAQIDQRL